MLSLIKPSFPTLLSFCLLYSLLATLNDDSCCMSCCLISAFVKNSVFTPLADYAFAFLFLVIVVIKPPLSILLSTYQHYHRLRNLKAVFNYYFNQFWDLSRVTRKNHHNVDVVAILIEIFVVNGQKRRQLKHWKIIE